MLGLQVIPGDERHALLLTKDGLIRRADLGDDAAEPTTFMDIRDRIIRNPGMEEGLLGLAFSPDYVRSGKFYVYYSAGDPRRAVISRFVASGDHADPATEHVLLEIPEPYANHNGGALAFGPIDGELYIGVGDGGSAGDPQGNGQNLGTLLGKILRIDVSGEDYTIPISNPFKAPDRPEIWAYGLRNPWRISFDAETGRLWVADVGQNLWEEVDVVDRGGNYGWSVMEGNHCFKPASGCDDTGLIRPLAEYSHDLGCSITGGFVYHGASMPELRGWYLYGDFCSGLRVGAERARRTRQRGGRTGEHRRVDHVVRAGRRGRGLPRHVRQDDPEADAAVAAQAGSNRTSVASSATSSNTARTGMSQRSSPSAAPTMFVTMRGPSSSSTTAYWYGVASSNPANFWCMTPKLYSVPRPLARAHSVSVDQQSGQRGRDGSRQAPQPAAAHQHQLVAASALVERRGVLVGLRYRTGV